MDGQEMADVEATTIASLGLDGTLMVLRKIDSISDVLRLGLVSRDFASALTVHLDTLEVLDLEGSDCDGEMLCRWFERAPALRTLQLGGTVTGLDIWQWHLLPAFNGLQRLGLSDTELDEYGLCCVWEHLSALTALDVSDCSLGLSLISDPSLPWGPART